MSGLLQDLERTAILGRDREREAAQLTDEQERGREEAATVRQQLETAQQELATRQQLIHQLQAPTAFMAVLDRLDLSRRPKDIK
jgi:5-bromo-4-chloroindolyl phosphate hydrolysis protein